ncbi:MAG: MAPEG family protein [Pseudolabrys sp.]|nr:MAPEG family protein [Pseudolabrys sp.]
MPIQYVLLPLFVQVLLTFGLGVLMFFARAGALRSRTVQWQSIALGEPGWPVEATKRANAFRNQFEIPVLFYVLIILLIITRHADVLMVALAWIFVLTRIAHAWIFVSNNYVPRRGIIFGVGVLVLLVMWIIFMVRILLNLP